LNDTLYGVGKSEIPWKLAVGFVSCIRNTYNNRSLPIAVEIVIPNKL